jgi:hypothetical protein
LYALVAFTKIPVKSAFSIAQALINLTKSALAASSRFFNKLRTSSTTYYDPSSNIE